MMESTFSHAPQRTLSLLNVGITVVVGLSMMDLSKFSILGDASRAFSFHVDSGNVFRNLLGK